jgi:hypothetical protein
MQNWKLLTKENWDDFEALFGKHRGVRGGCWCVFHQVGSGAANKLGKQGRHDFHEARVKEEGLATGLIYYDEGVPVAWCSFGPAKLFEQFERSRSYQALQKRDPWRPDWRIVCTFVDKDRRQKGLQAKVAEAAMQAIRQAGGGKVEVYPFDYPDSVKPNYNGTVRLFNALGFTEAERLGITVVMRKEI